MIGDACLSTSAIRREIGNLHVSINCLRDPHLARRSSKRCTDGEMPRLARSREPNIAAVLSPHEPSVCVVSALVKGGQHLLTTSLNLKENMIYGP